MTRRFPSVFGFACAATATAVVLAGAALVGAAGKDDKPAGPKVGDVAPDFSATAHDGKTVQLADFKGKKSVVLWFYPKALTKGCTKEGCNFRDDAEKFTAADAAILGVSFDTVEKQKEFAEKEKFPYPLLSDPKGDIAKAYGVPVSKTGTFNRSTVVIDKEGKISYVSHKVDIAGQNKTLLELLGKK